MEMFVGAVSIVASVIALFFSLHSYNASKSEVVRDFFLAGDSVEDKRFRKQIYDIYNNYSDADEIKNKVIENGEIAAYIVSRYDLWSLMADKKYLPFWTFEGMPGKTAINIHNKLMPYILHRRKTEPEYAIRFDKLISKIKLKYKY